MRGSLEMVLALAVVAGCDEAPVPCHPPDDVPGITVADVGKVDLLFVVDNSGSMSEEQVALAYELPRMIQILASGDVDEDGDNLDALDFDGVRDLHVGVVTTDMGTGGHAAPSCARPDLGDDGVLRTSGRTDLPGCSATYPNILDFRADSGVEPDAFAASVGCVATVGTSGCGFEQPLEAMLKALTPTARQTWTHPDFVPVGDPAAPEGLARPFFGGSSPHGNVANDGFVRDSSVLAIVTLSDEEDCSAHDPELFDPASVRYGETELNLRCFTYPEALHPIERYVNGLLQLRARPERLVFAPIVGIPVDLAPLPGETPDWDALAAPDCAARDPRMCERIDPTLGSRLVPSCSTGHGIAFPPVRIARVARELAARGANASVQSICDESYRGAVDAIVRQVRSGLASHCPSGRALPIAPDGSVPCHLIVELQAGEECDPEAGLTPTLDADGRPALRDGRALCTLAQLVPESREPGAEPPLGPGWYYDDFTTSGDRSCDAPSTEAPRVRFAGTQPPSGSNVSLVCSTPADGMGTECRPGVPDADPCPELRAESVPLACDPLRHACGVECASHADCADAGLVGWACDTRALGEGRARLRRRRAHLRLLRATDLRVSARRGGDRLASPAVMCHRSGRARAADRLRSAADRRRVECVALGRARERARRRIERRRDARRGPARGAWAPPRRRRRALSLGPNRDASALAVGADRPSAPTSFGDEKVRKSGSRPLSSGRHQRHLLRPWHGGL
ncbi:MAG: VWA domain-containing protein [Sandaracinaceae bacterium]|nr:VWA domain-containing protein [Sandaracinaceae bacterium]